MTRELFFREEIHVRQTAYRETHDIPVSVRKQRALGAFVPCLALTTALKRGAVYCLTRERLDIDLDPRVLGKAYPVSLNGKRGGRPIVGGLVTEVTEIVQNLS